jgi:hypothetical protein
MNLKTTYILFGLLVVVILAFVAFQFWGGDTTKGSAGDFLFADFHRDKDPLKSGEIDGVRIERTVDGKKETVRFAHGKDGWRIEEPYPARADSYQVDNLLRQVTGAQREKSEVSSNLKEYDLENPPLVVTLTKGDQEWKLNVGKQSAGTGGVVYVSNAAKAKEPAAVRKTALDSVFKKVVDFRAHELLTANAPGATAVELEAKGNALALEKTEGGGWRFKKPAYGPANFEGDTAAPPVPGVEKKVSGVRDLIDDAGGLRVEANDDFIAEGVSDADLAEKYGLEKGKPETLRVEVKAKSGDAERTETLLIGKKAPKEPEKKEGEKKDDKKPAEAPEYYYVRLEGENSVERIPAAKVKPLLDAVANPDALRSRELVATGAGKPDALDVQSGGGSFKLRQVDGKWTMYRDGARATDTDAVRELVEALTGDNPVTHKKQPVVKTFLAKDEGYDFDKPSAVVSVWIDGVKKEEKKEEKEGEKKEEKKSKEPELTSDKPAAKLTFGRLDKDKGLAYVKRESGGDTTFVTVSDAVYNQVTASYLAYLDRNLPTFSAGGFDVTKDVTKLTLPHGGQTWEVTKEKDGDKATWKFVQPQTLAGRTANELAVGGVLSELANLRAEKVVDEKPSEANLDAVYGLKAPDTKVIVTVKKDDKAEDWVYSFGKVYSLGKPDEKKNGVYAMVNKSDLVYLVPKATVDRLTSAEMRDLTVFKFDPKQVKGAKVSVWSNDLGAPLVLDLERKGDNDWAKKEGTSITPDGAKMDGLMRALSALRAAKIVTPKPNADTGLDVSKKALKVEITVDGGPIELLIGNEDPDNKGPDGRPLLFASSNKMLGEVFLLPENLGGVNLKDAKASPAWFRK